MFLKLFLICLHLSEKQFKRLNDELLSLLKLLLVIFLKFLWLICNLELKKLKFWSNLSKTNLNKSNSLKWIQGMNLDPLSNNLIKFKE